MNTSASAFKTSASDMRLSNVGDFSLKGVTNKIDGLKDSAVQGWIAVNEFGIGNQESVCHCDQG